MDERALVEEHLGLVKAIATRIAAASPRSVELDDLVGWGQEGLVHAARRFDPDRGVAFATFAYYRVRGAIFDGMRRARPATMTRRLLFEARADEYLERSAGEPPPPNPTAAAERLADAVADLAVAYVVTSERIEEAEDTTTPDPSSVAERRELLAQVRDRIGRLPDNERTLLELMYFEGLGLVEAGARLDMSKGWASRLHARALRRLREPDDEPEARGPPSGPAIRV